MRGRSGGEPAKLVHPAEYEPEDQSKNRPYPKTPIGYEVENGKHRRGREKSDQRLQESADERLLREAGKERDSRRVGDRPAAHHLELPFFKLTKRAEAADQPEGEERADSCEDPRKCGGRQGSLCRQPSRNPVGTQPETDQRHDRNHALLMDQGDRWDDARFRIFSPHASPRIQAVESSILTVGGALLVGFPGFF